MKKSILKCFEVEDAVQNGINEFGRLSGHHIKPGAVQKIVAKKSPINKGLLMMVVSLIAKGWK